MASNKWGVRSIQVRREQLHRLSSRFSRRIRRRLDTAAAREVIKRRLLQFFGTLAVVAVVGSFVGVKGLAYVRAQRMLVSVEEIRRGVSLIAAAGGGQLSGVPNNELLKELIGRNFLKQEIVTRVTGYRIDDAKVIGGTSNQYSLTIQCEDDGACRDLVLAYRKNPSFVLEKSQTQNPIIIAFRL